MTRPRTIGFLGFDGVQALDLFGPLECFALTREDSRCAYRTLVIGLEAGVFSAESGVRIVADVDVGNCPPLDTLIVPGGAGLRQADRLARAAAWLRERAQRTRRLASVCTGVYALAHAGLLDGHRATTHWRFVDDVAASYPAIDLVPDAIFVQDGAIWTSAGITAGIDLALALVEADHGRARALAVARELVVYLKRPGGQAQFSDRLALQTTADDRLADLAAWMASHIGESLSVDSLAERAGMSRRTFTRRFKATFGVSPARQVEQMRLDEARARLEAGRQSVTVVAAELGFASADAFSRAFERRFGLRPTAYSQRFGANGSAP